VTPATLTAIAGVVVSLIAVVVLPLVFRRQAAKQVKELENREAIKEAAHRDAALKVEESVSWEKINRALAATVQEERAANRERLVEQREEFNRELERVKRLTDDDLGRAKAEIERLAGQIRALEHRITQLSPRGEP
jgi:uncharacterized membrane protein YraQ (UPF0718 family)